jgi:hypothetical protein
MKIEPIDPSFIKTLSTIVFLSYSSVAQIDGGYSSASSKSHSLTLLSLTVHNLSSLSNNIIYLLYAEVFHLNSNSFVIKSYLKIMLSI